VLQILCPLFSPGLPVLIVAVYPVSGESAGIFINGEEFFCFAFYLEGFASLSGEFNGEGLVYNLTSAKDFLLRLRMGWN